MKYILFIILAVGLTGCTLNAARQNSTPPLVTTDNVTPTPSPAPTTVAEEMMATTRPTGENSGTSATENGGLPAVENGRPVAARVNNQPIYEETYRKQVGQLQQALTAGSGNGSEPDAEQLTQIRQQVLSTLIDQAIIEQEAAEAGITITDEMVEAKIQESITQGGGETQFEAWLAANNLTQDEFRERLRAELTANRMYEAITNYVPEQADQVEMSQIVVADDATAWDIIDQLKNGANFAELAQQYSIDESSRANNGNLGWFPQGLGLVPAEVEKIAFSIEPGQVSGPIQSSLGFHIIKLENREADRPLEELRPALKQQIFLSWLAEQRSAAEVETYIEF